MKLEEIKIIKSDDRGVIYNCGKVNFITRKKDTISADHSHQDKEMVYLVKGEAELTIGKETKIIKAPIVFEVPSDIHHKLVALTDISLVIDRSE